LIDTQTELPNDNYYRYRDIIPISYDQVSNDYMREMMIPICFYDEVKRKVYTNISEGRKSILHDFYISKYNCNQYCLNNVGALRTSSTFAKIQDYVKVSTTEILIFIIKKVWKKGDTHD
jgi:hypothetical protein